MKVKAPKPVMLGQFAVIPDEFLVDLGKRFWSSIDYPHGKDGCWEFRKVTKRGYGRHYIGKEGVVAKEFGAHRLSYFHHNKGADQSLLVCHKCDNRRCVNPTHLFLGTCRDNVQDMLAKGRTNWRRGQEHASSKYTPAQILEMRRLHATGLGYTKIARKVGASKTVVARVMQGKTWTHIQLEAAA